MRLAPLIGLLALLWTPLLFAAETEHAAAHGAEPAYPPAPFSQSQEAADTKSQGCLTCHTATDLPTMHLNGGVILGCVDCHGGNPTVAGPGGPVLESGSAYRTAMDKAHVMPRFPKEWHYPKSANPERTYTLLNRESPDFIRFMNPSDYRVVREACGACHLPIIQRTDRSLMSTTAMLWGGASYNNGIVPYKNYILGEAYTREGEAASVQSPVEIDAALRKRGALSQLLPLPAWETIPPGDIFRVFERGGRNIVSQFPEIGLPNSNGQLQRIEEPGRPDIRQSNRGPGTGLRIAVPVINIHKTRLNDPLMWFMGTNDQPGDFRNSGCAGCHVVYANDRDPKHSGPYAPFGNMGATQTVDPTIPKNEKGHPLTHGFSRAIPSAQCMSCHMHQPNVFVNSFLGYTMWDYESDAPLMWPEKQRYPTDSEAFDILMRNPEEAAIRGKWGDVDFLKDVSKLNSQTKNTQFADYHGHGWNFRAIFKQDRKGNLLDAEGAIVPHDDPKKFEKTVHMASIHLEKGMHCVDCHFEQDAHGNGLIYGEVASAIEIGCADCHGTSQRAPTLRTSGPAARPGGYDFSGARNADGTSRFEWRGKKLFQRSAVNPGMEWEVRQVIDSVTPGNEHYNEKSARAKLMSNSVTQEWGPSIPVAQLAHKDEEMMCVTCHTSWTTSCGGCHLPIQANWKTERQHYEGGETRNFATYNPQVARDDIFQLGRHSTAKNNIIAPVRSSSALVLSSTNINREKLYIQQPPIAASGYSSQAFAPHYAHTERTVETKTCNDCHLSADKDNNAIMAQLLLLGTNFVNFIGYNAWVGLDGGIEAVAVTEWDEPQAVIGSYLHRYAYPDYFKQHQDRGMELVDSESRSAGETRCIQLRGEYLYAAEGSRGMRAYDVASIANKGVSQKILSAPVSPLGQDTRIRSKNATCVVLPSTQPMAPDRNKGDLMRVDNEEQPIHAIYRYAFITDSEEGLIATNVDTLVDGEPRNNYFERALTWNPDGLLTGARHLAIAGTVFYVSTDHGVVVLDMDDPLHPKKLAVIDIPGARSAAVQFRYLFVTSQRGLEVVDITHPAEPRLVDAARVPLADARRVYVARTFAYVAAGADGLAIVDVEKPEAPKLYMKYTAEGRMQDANDVVVGTTNASLFAYVADGKGGLKVIQLTSPESQPGYYGFSPDPKPALIATRKTDEPALSVSKGLDRDRAVDETGQQIAVFGRLGSRPFTLPEMQKLYLDSQGKPWYTRNEVVRSDFRAPPGVTTGPVPRAASAAPPAAVAPATRSRPTGPTFRRPGS